MRWLLVLALLSATTGCRARLRIREVAVDAVRLQGGSPNNTTLVVESASGQKRRLPLRGQVLNAYEDYVIFEEAGYSGEPVPAIYRGQKLHSRTRGMKVPEGFFMAGQTGGAISYRITGRMGLLKVSDTVKLGSRPRPDVGGDFAEDTASPLPLPSEEFAVVRKHGWEDETESGWDVARPTIGRGARRVDRFSWWWLWSVVPGGLPPLWHATNIK